MQKYKIKSKNLQVLPSDNNVPPILPAFLALPGLPFANLLILSFANFKEKTYL